MSNFVVGCLTGALMGTTSYVMLCIILGHIARHTVALRPWQTRRVA